MTIYDEAWVAAKEAEFARLEAEGLYHPEQEHALPDRERPLELAVPVGVVLVGRSARALVAPGVGRAHQGVGERVRRRGEHRERPGP